MSVMNSSQLCFVFLSFPGICSRLRPIVTGKHLYQDSDKTVAFVLGLLQLLLCSCVWKEQHFPLLSSCSDEWEFFLSCSSFSDGSGFLPTHPHHFFEFLNKPAQFILSVTSSLLLWELGLHSSTFLLSMFVIQKTNFIPCP